MDAAAYAEPGMVCAVTIATQDRRLVFANTVVASAAVDIIRQQAQKTGVVVYAYCIMPDHVHLVVSPSQDCDVLTFVGRFKNLVQRAAWGQGIAGTIWQRSFWDHILRGDEAVEAEMTYVLNNPVRRGLVSFWREYPYAGSLAIAL